MTAGEGAPNVPQRRTLRFLLAGLLAAAMGPAAMAAEPSADGKLTVVVENLRSDRGLVWVALWKDAKGFTKSKAALARLQAPAGNGAVSFTFAELAAGRYALATYHDENANGEMDLTWIGWPKEGLGFSNGAWIGLLGAPSFKAAAVEVEAGAKSIVIPLRY
ncbi:MAG: DUF2141 domain-containing protein [Rhodospirillales bacterium]|nr:DUF2141 domain-containing protein [Rhodospirillales bacterium]MDH3917605.1 DUF2141 domain-containing protein [Rhodospirillales bacterium]MDH3968875.1 DUF2141 domain-containing protein [Rhodospirillales bacterium]